jgi:hypothetical protein
LIENVQIRVLYIDSDLFNIQFTRTSEQTKKVALKILINKISLPPYSKFIKRNLNLEFDKIEMYFNPIYVSGSFELKNVNGSNRLDIHLNIPLEIQAPIMVNIFIQL